MELQKPASIKPGERVTLATRCLISQDRNPKYSLYVKEPEKTPIKVVQEGPIQENRRGRISIEIENTTNDYINLPEGFVLAYLIMSPFYM